MLKFEINDLCTNKCLGKVISVESINGGFMHSMYKVVTSKGCYAIKKLNKHIVSNNNALDSYNKVELLSNFVNNNGIKTSYALNFDGNYIVDYNDNYYLIYNYCKGLVFDDNEITVNHCKKIGEVIAKIHLLNYRNLGYEENIIEYKRLIDWDILVNNERFNSMPYKEEFIKKYKNYNNILMKANEAFNNINVHQTICHNDIILSNVLWENDEPVIIDFETAGMSSSLRELASTAIHFSGFDSNNFNEEKYKAVIGGYINWNPIYNDNYEEIVYSELISKLWWLRYLIEKSLGVKTISEQEMLKSKNEVIVVINQIDRYLELVPTLENCFDEVINNKSNRKVL